MGLKQTWLMVFYVGVAMTLALFFSKASGAYGDKLLFGTVTTGHAIGLVLGLAITAFFATYKKSKVFVAESFDQIVKVAWPSKDETKTNTIVVVVFSFVASGILGVFDFVFNGLTSENFFLY
ncbi:MAG: preprotein translocase subunit SecE [Deltaproteobacteria bacterium]|nr:preprotein translocase subunit SecE [Deltaproteobacteria bacterium]